MQITRRLVSGVMEVEIAGRLDGYWSDHLSAALREVLRGGTHHLRVDCSQVTYLTSAGIGVLVQFYKELGRIHGTMQVVNPSPPVSTILSLTRLDKLLIAPADAAPAASTREPPARSFDREDVGFAVYELDARATLTCRALGSAAPLERAGFTEEHSTSFAAAAPTLAVGVGAFGASFADCRPRFGELVSVAGATAYQPGDGTNVADYLVTGSHLGSEIRVLYCLACNGRFSHLVRFEARPVGGVVGLSRLLEECLDAAACNSLGLVMVAEASGLVGAALRHAPTEPIEAGTFFAHPGIRTRLSFTTERAFPRSVVMAAGVVRRNDGRVVDASGQLRPIGTACTGHVHAAAFRFRPIRKGPISLDETVTGLFEPDQLLGVLHLLYDDRAVAGSGESEFVRGACWIGPIVGNWPGA